MKELPIPTRIFELDSESINHYNFLALGGMNLSIGHVCSEHR